MNSPASLRALSGFPVATTHGYQRHRHVHAAASPRQTGAPPPLPPPASQLTQASSPPPWQQQPGDPPRQAGRKQPQQQTTRGGRPWGQQEHVALERQQQGRQPQRAPLPADPQRRQQQQQVSTAPKQQRQGQASQRRMPPPAQQEQQGGVPHRRGVPGQQAAPWAGALVVVEGRNDMRAVRQAAPDADVFVLGTSTLADSRRVLQELEGAAGRYPRGLLALLDPDVAGRQARAALDDALPGRCRHAFLPAPLATAGAATRYHEAGNVGVEHAAPGAIRAALAAARPSDPGRQAFSREDLLRWGLVAELHARGGAVTERRALLCDCLGLGACDGKQLLRQLNRYCFGEAEVAAALAWAERQLQLRAGGGGGADAKAAGAAQQRPPPGPH